MRRFHSARESFSSGPFAGSAMPALLTRASSRPKRFTTARTQARTAGSLETSVRWKENGLPRPVGALVSATATR